MSTDAISNLSHEDRHFDPPAELAEDANLKADAYDEAADDRLAFWAKQAERISWAQADSTTSSTGATRRSPSGTSADASTPRTTASTGTSRRATATGWPSTSSASPRATPATSPTASSRTRSAKAANADPELGVETGDRVAIYMPMIPETIIAMLACARLGAPHTVVFGGFSADALATRVVDCGAKVIITATAATAAARRRRSSRPSTRRSPRSRMRSRTSSRTSSSSAAPVRTSLRTTTATSGGTRSSTKASTDHTPEDFDSEHPLYVMYTSGTTGKPKGILHTTGGYLVQCAYSFWGVFDQKDDDVYWCTADVGWVTGHSYIVYGPLACGATQVLYEGTPDTPHKGRWWEIIQDKGVTKFYTAPTAIRTCMKWGEQIPAEFDLSKLRILGSVGESINPEAYVWYRDNIGGGKTPIVDTWWQTETGAHMISPLPGVTSGKPGSAMTPIPGISADVVDDDGKSVANGSGGYLVLTEPWPAMLRTIWGDDERYKETYWSRWKGVYFAGDGAKKDDDGDIWLLGRVDDVMNVSGHRLSTTEIESALVSHPKVAEAAVVGATDETKGQAPVAFVILRESALVDGEKADDAVLTELRDHVGKQIGAIAKPRQILVVSELPKTRSGKIMRRLLRDVAENREVGDATTLADSTVMDQISEGMKTAKDED